MPETPNGLASMTQARERRARRSMPPPRHPAPAPKSEAAPEQPEASVPSSSSASSGRAAVSSPAVARSAPAGPVQESKPAPSSSGASARAASGAPKPSTVYLDEADIEFLELARIAGLSGQPRLDVAKSAVVRLALRRLREQMSVEEIRVYLMGQPTDPAKTGRKRR